MYSVYHPFVFVFAARKQAYLAKTKINYFLQLS